jgi:hypothetical protein
MAKKKTHAAGGLKNLSIIPGDYRSSIVSGRGMDNNTTENGVCMPGATNCFNSQQSFDNRTMTVSHLHGNNTNANLEVCQLYS